MPDDWTRIGTDTLTRGTYRIEKSHVLGAVGLEPVYHAHVARVFLGAFPDADAAKAACEWHADRSGRDIRHDNAQL